MSHQPPAPLIRAGELATIPNLLSFTRIVGITVSVALYIPGHRGLALAIGTLAGLTDFLDGYMARRLQQETTLGAMLDQAADSFTTAILLAMLVVVDGLPFAFLVIFLLREFWVATIRRYGATAGIEIPSSSLGKLATALIYFAILTAAIALLPEGPEGLSSGMHVAALVGLGAGLLLSCATAWQYTRSLTVTPT
jgi:CDP-diacylglycerol--glycerol-3-phosphate 3-phosphatidyltransferase